VLTTEFGSFTQAKQAIGQIGRAVYQYDRGEKLTLPQLVRKRKASAAPAKTKSKIKAKTKAPARNRG
jgi:hypothetical protein